MEPFDRAVALIVMHNGAVFHTLNVKVSYSTEAASIMYQFLQVYFTTERKYSQPHDGASSCFC